MIFQFLIRCDSRGLILDYLVEDHWGGVVDSDSPCRHINVMQFQNNMLETGIVGIGMDGEAQGTIQLQHRFILLQHFAVDFPDAARARS